MNKETQIHQLMQDSLGVKGPFTLELLSGGFSGSEVVKVNTLDKTFVVRFWNMQWAEYFPQDLACQLIASEADYGPKVYFSDEEKGITVMEYYFPEALPEFDMMLKALVDLLKKIHTGPDVPKGIDRAVYLNLLLDETKDTSLFDVKAIRTIKDQVFAVTRPYADMVTCHRDLHHGNLLYTQNRFFAIDYTWGAMDDLFADLANIAIFNCKTLNEEKQLLQLYFGHEPTPIEIARLSLMKLPVKIFYGLEFIEIGSTNANHYETKRPAAPKSLMEFGQHGVGNLSSHDLLLSGISFLNEIIDYSLSGSYSKDLNLVSAKNGP